MHSRVWILYAAVACLMFAPPALANQNDNGGGTGNNNNNNPRPTPGLDAAMLTGLSSMGYMAYQFVKTRNMKK